MAIRNLRDDSSVDSQQKIVKIGHPRHVIVNNEAWLGGRPMLLRDLINDEGSVGGRPMLLRHGITDEGSVGGAPRPLLLRDHGPIL